MRRRWSTLIKDMRASGHLDRLDRAFVHALLAVVDRLLVIDFGRAASPTASRDAVMASRRCKRSIWGSRPMPDADARGRGLTAFYGDFQALFGIDLDMSSRRASSR